MIDRTSTEICSCCARQATGYGYAERRDPSRILWVCDDPRCLRVAKDSFAMKQDEFTRIESLAAGKGGEEAGAFLDQIGKSDLAQLSPDEWFEFCRRMVAGYRKALQHDLAEAAPF